MIHSLILLAAILAAIWLYGKWKALSDEERSQRGRKYLLWVLISVLLLLVLTGRTHWLFALLAAFLAFFQRMFHLLKYFPLFKRLYDSFMASGGRGKSWQNKQAPKNSTMSRSEAADILGIKETATKQEVVAAHRRLMQKVHPDRGGSDALASQINEAKKVMLG